MNPGRREPDDEARLVQAQHEAVLGAEDQQCDACREQRHRRGDDERGEHPQRQARRAFRPIDAAARVVAQEAPPRASELQRHRRDQQHPDEHVRRQHRPDRQDRHALRGKQNEQHRAGQGGETLVAIDASRAARPSPREGHRATPAPRRPPTERPGRSRPSDTTPRGQVPRRRRRRRSRSGCR